MEYDYEARDIEIRRIVDASESIAADLVLECNASDPAGEITLRLDSRVRQFVSASPPEKAQGVRFHLTTIDNYGFGRESTSRRLGNMRFNLGDLFRAGVTLSLAMPASMAFPWAVPLIVARAMVDLYKGMTVKLSERDACVAWVMWHISDPSQLAPRASLLEAVNHHRKEHQRSSISQRELDDSTNQLVRLGFIEYSEADPEKWWLRDWVSFKYS